MRIRNWLLILIFQILLFNLQSFASTSLTTTNLLITITDLKIDEQNYSQNFCHELELKLSEQFNVKCLTESPFLPSTIEELINTNKPHLMISILRLNNQQNKFEISTEYSLFDIKKESYIFSTSTMFPILQIQQYLNYKNKKSSYYQGQKIILDTSDKKACFEIKNFIQNQNITKNEHSMDIEDICKNKDLTHQNRFITITTMWETEENFYNEIQLKNFKNKNRNLYTETRNLSFLMAGAVGLLWVLPESVSKWNKHEIRQKGFLNKFKDNIKSKPVKDKDDWAINYIGHPISGAAYYNIARGLGYDKLESFGYSVLMSTFFWEYGFEAIAEKPSIQDLLITPVIGSIMGEAFFQLSEKIQNENNGKVLGSKKMGQLALFLLNPAQSISNQVNRIFESKIVQNSKFNLVLGKRKSYNFQGINSNYMGLQLDFYWY